MAVMCLNTGKQQKHSPLQLLAATCKKIGRPTSPLLDKRPPAKKLYQPYNYVPNSPPISPPNNDSNSNNNKSNDNNTSNNNNNSNNNNSNNNSNPGIGTPISVQCESSYQSPSSPSLKLNERSDIRFSVSPISPNSTSAPRLGERDHGHSHQLPAMPSPRGHDMRGHDHRGPSPRGHDIHGPSGRCQDIRAPSPIRIQTAMAPEHRLHSPRSIDMRHSPRGQDMRVPLSRGQDMRGHSPRGQENAHMRGHWRPGDMDRSRISPPSMSTPPPGSKVPSCTACSQGLCCDRGRRVPSHPPTLTPPRSPYPQRSYYPVQPSPHSPHPNTSQHPPPPPTSPRVLINSHNMTSQQHMTSHHHHMASHEQKQSTATPPPSEMYHHPHMFSRRIIPPLGPTYATPGQRFAMRPNPPPQGPVTTATRTRRRCECPNCVGGNQNMSASKPKQHICHIPGCGKVYGKTSHLRAHLRWHAGLRPFICNWLHCGKSFTRSDELQRHLKTHTGEKRFACSECDKRFLRSDHLSKHMKTHQNKAAAQAAQAKTAEAELVEPKIEECDSEEDETVDVEVLAEDLEEK